MATSELRVCNVCKKTLVLSWNVKHLTAKEEFRQAILSLQDDPEETTNNGGQTSDAPNPPGIDPNAPCDIGDKVIIRTFHVCTG